MFVGQVEHDRDSCGVQFRYARQQTVVRDLYQQRFADPLMHPIMNRFDCLRIRVTTHVRLPRYEMWPMFHAFLAAFKTRCKCFCGHRIIRLHMRVFLCHVCDSANAVRLVLFLGRDAGVRVSAFAWLLRATDNLHTSEPAGVQLAFHV